MASDPTIEGRAAALNTLVDDTVHNVHDAYTGLEDGVPGSSAAVLSSLLLLGAVMESMSCTNEDKVVVALPVYILDKLTFATDPTEKTLSPFDQLKRFFNYGCETQNIPIQRAAAACLGLIMGVSHTQPMAPGPVGAKWVLDVLQQPASWAGQFLAKRVGRTYEAIVPEDGSHFYGRYINPTDGSPTYVDITDAWVPPPGQALRIQESRLIGMTVTDPVILQELAAGVLPLYAVTEVSQTESDLPDAHVIANLLDGE